MLGFWVFGTPNPELQSRKLLKVIVVSGYQVKMVSPIHPRGRISERHDW